MPPGWYAWGWPHPAHPREPARVPTVTPLFCSCPWRHCCHGNAISTQGSEWSRTTRPPCTAAPACQSEGFSGEVTGCGEDKAEGEEPLDLAPLVSIRSCVTAEAGPRPQGTGHRGSANPGGRPRTRRFQPGSRFPCSGPRGQSGIQTPPAGRVYPRSAGDHPTRRQPYEQKHPSAPVTPPGQQRCSRHSLLLTPPPFASAVPAPEMPFLHLPDKTPILPSELNAGTVFPRGRKHTKHST